MTQGIRLIVYPVRDLARAKALFRAVVGAEPYADSPYYVGFRAGELEIGLDPNGHANGPGPLAYWKVADLAASIRTLREAGATVAQDIKDVGGGKRIALLHDADGNVIALMQDP